MWSAFSSYTKIHPNLFFIFKLPKHAAKDDLKPSGPLASAPQVLGL